jgi:hypothetical protein
MLKHISPISNDPLYVVIASAISARKRCEGDKSHKKWYERWTTRLNWIAANRLPHGSGVDNGTTIDIDRSTEDRIILYTAYHHMNETGMYDGWTEHSIIITPSLVCRFHIRITGRDRNDIKNYLTELFSCALADPVGPIPEEF